MDFYKREIERKFIIKEINYYRAIESLLANDAHITTPTIKSFDVYWNSAKVDFVRLRGNTKELTVKVTDKTTIIDRIEENVVVEDIDTAKRLTTLLCGEPSLTITKKFSVFNIFISPAPGTKFEAILCLYEVEGDRENRLFFEVEAESIKIVDLVVKKFEEVFLLQPESRSLYQIFTGVK